MWRPAAAAPMTTTSLRAPVSPSATSLHPATGVRRLEPLSGEGYEAWVAGLDPDTGVPKGRLRHDANAVRFVEVGVNGPKSWSLAAELHPDVSAAYDAAQDSAARQIIGWLAEHATTRVGGARRAGAAASD